MNTKISPMDEQHKNIVLLLPWYLNKGLSQQEQLQVDAHVKSCLLCRRELIGLRKLSEAVMQTSEMDMMADTSFANLSAKLVAKTGQMHDSNPSLPIANKSLLPFFGRKLIRYALAASLVLGVLPLGLIEVMQSNNPTYQTLSTATPPSGQTGHLRVVFATSTTLADIDAVLIALNGQQVGEPNSLGAFTIQLHGANPDLQKALAMLRNRKYVVLAEPVLEP